MFDSTDLTWRLSDKKIMKTKLSISNALQSDRCSLKEWQKLMGKLNDISQLCSFMKVFRRPINECIQGIESDAPPHTEIAISATAHMDLLVWAGFLEADHKWLPISRAYEEPPRFCKEFVSDAAGLSADADFRTRPGCGNVAFDASGHIIFASQYLWPEEFISEAIDEKGVRFGDKTTTLEMIGLLMPFILVPELLANQHARFMVDCFGTVFGMQNKAAKGDTNASIFIRAAYLIAAYIGCTVHVQQLPRMSDWGAEVSDRLSRASTTTTQDKKLLKAFHNRNLPVCLLNWFRNPTQDYHLASELLDHVKSIM
jgi:hypothetical protein